MTESKHTPGPWELTTLESNHGDSQHFISPGSCKPTLMAGTCSTEDAHLIAAAPELLRALEEVVALADRAEANSPQTIADALDLLNLAADVAARTIAKARGVEA